MISPKEFRDRDQLELYRKNVYGELFAICLNKSNDLNRDSYWVKQVGLFTSDDEIFLAWDKGAMLKWAGPDDFRFKNGGEFIDFLMQNYPKYVVWFLFHPEWL